MALGLRRRVATSATVVVLLAGSGAGQDAGARLAMEDLLGVRGFTEEAATWHLESARAAPGLGRDGSTAVVLERGGILSGRPSALTIIDIVAGGRRVTLHVDALSTHATYAVDLEAAAFVWDESREAWNMVGDWSAHEVVPEADSWTPLRLDIDLPEGIDCLTVTISTPSRDPVTLSSVSLTTDVRSHPASPGSVGAWTVDELQSERRRLSALVESVRDRSFLRSPPVRVVDTALMRARHGHAVGWFPEAEFARIQTALHELGLWPRDAVLDYRRLVSGGLDATPAGLMVPGSGTVLLHSVLPEASGRLVLAHELCHVLEYTTIPEIAEGWSAISCSDLDAFLVRRIVEEGTAIVTMAQVERRCVAEGTLPPDALDRMLAHDLHAWREDPRIPILGRRLLTAPYSIGPTFLKRGDPTLDVSDVPAKDLDRALMHLPRSTEQLLHPERYWEAEHEDLPRQVSLGDLSAALGPEWDLAGSGTCGELILAQLVPGEFSALPSVAGTDLALWATDATTGWGGDAWQIYAFGDRRLVVLATLWDSEHDAVEFHSMLQAAHPTLALRRCVDAVVAVAGERVILGDRLADAALQALVAN